MKNLSKNRKNILSKIDLTKTYNANDAIKILKENSFVKFDETLDVAIKLNINASKRLIKILEELLICPEVLAKVFVLQ